MILYLITYLDAKKLPALESIADASTSQDNPGWNAIVALRDSGPANTTIDDVFIDTKSFEQS